MGHTNINKLLVVWRQSGQAVWPHPSFLFHTLRHIASGILPPVCFIPASSQRIMMMMMMTTVVREKVKILKNVAEGVQHSWFSAEVLHRGIKTNRWPVWGIYHRNLCRPSPAELGLRSTREYEAFFGRETEGHRPPFQISFQEVSSHVITYGDDAAVWPVARESHDKYNTWQRGRGFHQRRQSQTTFPLQFHKFHFCTTSPVL